MHGIKAKRKKILKLNLVSTSHHQADVQSLLGSRVSTLLGKSNTSNSKLLLPPPQLLLLSMACNIPLVS